MTSEVPTEERKPDRMAKARAAKKAKADATKAEPAESAQAKRARLLNELASLPDEPITPPKGAVPGTEVKDGLGSDKVPWTPAVLREYCDRGVVVDGFKFEWKSLTIEQPRDPIGWNGIHYRVYVGIENKIPSPHYYTYMQSQADLRRERARWNPEPNPPVEDGYVSPPHIFKTSGPLEPREA